MAVFFKVVILATALWSTMACSDPNYADHPSAALLVEEMVSEHDFKREDLLAIFAAAQRKDSILKAIARPAERTKAWYEYRAIFLNEKREVQGVEFYNTHRETLMRAERELGVPAHVIVSIIGVETYYGRNAGSYRVIDALSTLAFDYPKRSTFFTKELKNFLLLTRDQGLDPLAFKGSYAGAMGYGQFMPSSYRSYAIDFDGDGLIDIWNNPVDAIGSVANYFKRHGWRTGETVVLPAQATADVSDDWFVRTRADLKPKKNVAEFSLAGITTEQERKGSELATAMKFELEDGYEYWLGLHNFYVITRYNHSAMYAMSVHQLSEKLASQFPQ
ncbi:MAG: lytic murein transglycosylase B [Halioglobus sp.]